MMKMKMKMMMGWDKIKLNQVINCHNNNKWWR